MLFRKKPPANPSPPWLKWATIAFLVLALLSNLRKHGPDQPGSIPDAIHTAAKNLSPGKLIDIEGYKKALFPDYGAALNMKDTELGKGPPAICGQEVKITYDDYVSGDKPNETNKTATFHIGAGETMPALEQGVVGMAKGGKRSIVSPPKMAPGVIPSATQPIRFEVELLDATPALPDLNDTPYRIAIVAEGNGPLMLCGKLAKVHIKLWSIDGKKLDERTITFTPGKSEVFLGLEQGVIGMAQGGVRTLVVPPIFQKTMNENPSAAKIPLPQNQTVLVDVESLP